VNQLVPSGMLALLSGKDKRGKTLLAQEILRAVLQGTALFTHYAVVQAPVVAAFLDDPLSITLDRLDTLGVRRHPELFLVDPLRFMGDPFPFLDELETAARARQAGLIEIDALYLLSPTTRDAGNDAARMTPIMRRLDQLATRTAAAVLVVAHDNKSGQDVAGSYAIRAMAKTILRLTLPKSDESATPDDGAPTTPRRVLSLESKLCAAGAVVLELHGVGKWHRLGAPADVRLGDVKAAIKTYLADAEDSEAEAIYTSVPGRREAKVAALRELRGAGEVSRHGDGKKGDPYLYRLQTRADANSSSRGSSSGREPETRNDASAIL